MEPTETNDGFFFWLQTVVYDGRWNLDCDMLDYLLGYGQ